MKVLLQRVASAQVAVADEIVGKINHGLVVLIGVANNDSTEDIDYLVRKIVELRIFDDAEGKFNLSALDVKGELLLVSQFTLLASTRKGRRPGFTEAAPPETAEALFNQFVAQTRLTGLKVETGRFQTHMHVEIHNDGPVTIYIDSQDRLNSRNG
jgi:D-tyrosyl-tRNA(Tyr) deacylase